MPFGDELQRTRPDLYGLGLYLGTTARIVSYHHDFERFVVVQRFATGQ